MMCKSVLIALGTVALAACHGGTQLSATPSALSSCPESANGSVVTVQWNASKDVKDGTVKLWVRSPNGDDAEPTMWAAQLPEGSLATGKWAVPGMQISLTDANGAHTLAQIRIGRTPCKH
ncbi:hypothetical protein [Rhodanobacter sp. C03]|uniref:hypothetical protein n=1 Tax=Rhodanobacter sp. C03 TaxID=1945858 RepID=UPI00098590FC|nr:hypothetical protein [Rhodanobacter sp. C03]OOG55549.1 hypothetical protein B0E48_12975 [Rhodanobacter sp. C03]